jgi:hypothetical protein
MVALLDIIFSSIFGGLLLLQVYAMQNEMIEANHVSNLVGSVQHNSVDLRDMLTRDLHTAGLSVPEGTPVFLHADSLLLEFRGDLDQDGTWNTIRYEIDDDADMTDNPEDHLLYRQIDGGEAQAYAFGITGGGWSCLDAGGAPAATLDDIRQVAFRFTFESTFGYDNRYPGAYLRNRIALKNMW